mgnify:CR=1 FL=1
MTSEHRLGAWALTWRYLLAFCWVPLPLAVLLVEQDLPREPPPAFSGFLILEILGVIAALVLIRFRRRAPMLVTVSLSALSSVAVSLGGFASWGVPACVPGGGGRRSSRPGPSSSDPSSCPTRSGGPWGYLWSRTCG